MRSGMKLGRNALSLILALSMMGSSLLGSTMAFAKTESSTTTLSSMFAMSEINPAAQEAAPALFTAEEKTGGAKGYVQPFVDPSSFKQAEFPKTLARAASEFPSTYDVRTTGRVTNSIRNQTAWGTCWAFGATGAAESSLYPEDDTVFSPRHLAYFTYNNAANPDVPEDGTAGDTFHAWTYDPSETSSWWHPWYEYGGNTFMSNATFSRIGIQTDEAVPYPETYDYFDYSNLDSYWTPSLKEEYLEDYGDVKEEHHYTAPYRLVESNYLPTMDQDGNLNGDAIKKVLMDGYSVAIAYASGNYNSYTMPDGSAIVAQRYNGPEQVVINHEVQIVGWDDTIPPEAFQNGDRQPKNSGGWLIRNSWGADWGMEGDLAGCFYLSYEDSSISETCQFIASADQPYDHNYQYDGTGWSTTVGVKDNPTAPVYMSNIFTATGDQTVKAAAFYTTTHDAKYSIQVYTGLKDPKDPTSGTPAFAKEQKGSKTYAGYQTVDLNTPVNVNDGEKFSIVVKMQIPETTDQMWYYETMYPIACELNGYCDGITSDADIVPGESFISYDGGKWLDLTDYDEPRYGTDGESEITLANVCLKAFTVDGHHGVTPEAVNPLTVIYGRGATMTVDGNVNEIINGAGFYMAKMIPGDSADLKFVPDAEGREFIDVTVNGEEDTSFTKDSYTYTVTMDGDKADLRFVFDVVNKQVLNYALKLAEEAQKSEEYDNAVSAVQKKLDEAVVSGKKISEGSTATQEEIDAAWNELIDAMQMLQFKCGNLSALGRLLDACIVLREEVFTADSWEIFAKVYAEAQAMYDAEDSIQEEIDEMVEKLADAMNGLVRAADASGLQKLVDEANTYDPDDYMQDAAWKNFQSILGKAEVLLEKGGTQSGYDTMQTRLALAMTEIRMIPDAGKLQDLIDKTADVTDKNVAAAREAAIGALTADKQTMGAAYYALQDAYDAYVKNISTPDTDNSSKSHSSKGGSSKNSGSAYAGDGFATVTVPAAAGAVVSSVSVISDTTLPFTLKRGSAYCFKMTVVGSTTAVPSFTAGNGGVLKTQFIAKVGNDYYFRVYAVGTPGSSTGVYTTLPGQQAQRHCVITIG